MIAKLARRAQRLADRASWPRIFLICPLSSATAHVQFFVAVGEPTVLTALLVTICLVLRRFLPRALFDLPTRGTTAPRHRAEVSARTSR